MPILYITLGLSFASIDKPIYTFVFCGIGLAWYFLYPFWEKQRYIKHYQVFIRENYKDILGRIATLELNNDYILAKDNGNESKVLTAEIKKINEIPSAIYIRLNGGQSFLLPKDKT